MKAKLEACDFKGNNLKGNIEKVSGINKSLTVEALEKKDIAPFEICFGNATNLVKDATGKRYYMSIDTIGHNWRVSDETTEKVLATDESYLGYSRVFYLDECTIFRTMNIKKDYVFDFIAPFSAYYKMYLDVYKVDSGGKADVYLNDVYVGSVDTYSTEGVVETIELGTHRLKSGWYANKVKIVPTGASYGSKYYPSFIGFKFEIV